MTTDVDVAALDREWMEAWRRNERETCERLIGDDFLLTSARGVWMSKADWLAGAMGPFVFHTYGRKVMAGCSLVVFVAQTTLVPAVAAARLGHRGIPGVEFVDVEGFLLLNLAAISVFAILSPLCGISAERRRHTSG